MTELESLGKLFLALGCAWFLVDIAYTIKLFSEDQ